MRSPWYDSLWWYFSRLFVYFLPLCGYSADGVFYPFDEIEAVWREPVPMEIAKPWVWCEFDPEIGGYSPYHRGRF